MAPRLSFCIPVSPDGAWLLGRTLTALRAQSADPALFEVIVGVDGGDPRGEVARAMGQCLPFHVELVDSPRSCDLPHRNHARNAALRRARGDLIWITDADYLWAPWAVAHAIAAMDDLAGRGAPATLSPVYMEVDLPPDAWRALDPAALGEPAELLRLFRELPRKHEYSGFGEREVRAAAPVVADVGTVTIKEGLPLSPRAVLEALGGFDESFLGWGGNKIELCTRLGAIPELPYRLLTSVTALHQPHEKDRLRDHAHPLTQRNVKRYLLLREEVAAGAPWWLQQRQRVVAALRGLMAARGPAC